MFIRVSRMGVPEVYPEDYEFVPGTRRDAARGRRRDLDQQRHRLWRALVAAEQLADEGISARVISMPTVKPLDVEAVLQAAAGDGGHRDRRGGDRLGGLGRCRRRDRRAAPSDQIKILGVPEFAPTGSAGFLLDRYGMSPEGIAEAARKLIT